MSTSPIQEEIRSNHHDECHAADNHLVQSNVVVNPEKLLPTFEMHDVGEIDVEEEEQDKKPLEVVKIGEGKPAEIITGLVQPIRRTKQPPKTDTIDRLEAQRQQAEAAQRDRIRRIIAQDEEWLMMA